MNVSCKAIGRNFYTLTILAIWFYSSIATDAQGISSTPSNMFFSTDIANYFKF